MFSKISTIFFLLVFSVFVVASSASAQLTTIKDGAVSADEKLQDAQSRLDAFCLEVDIPGLEDLFGKGNPFDGVETFDAKELTDLLDSLKDIKNQLNIEELREMFSQLNDLKDTFGELMDLGEFGLPEMPDPMSCMSDLGFDDMMSGVLEGPGDLMGCFEGFGDLGGAFDMSGCMPSFDMSGFGGISDCLQNSLSGFGSFGNLNLSDLDLEALSACLGDEVELDLDGMMDKLSGMVGDFTGAISSMGNMIQSLGSILNVAEGLYSKLTAMIDKIKSLTDLLDKVKGLRGQYENTFDFKSMIALKDLYALCGSDTLGSVGSVYTTESADDAALIKKLRKKIKRLKRKLNAC